MMDSQAPQSLLGGRPPEQAECFKLGFLVAGIPIVRLTALSAFGVEALYYPGLLERGRLRWPLLPCPQPASLTSHP